MIKKAKKKNVDRGKFAMKYIRPTARDLAALEVVSDKMGGIPEAQVWRVALHHFVEFKGLQEQVAKRAHLLDVAGA